LAYFLQTGAIQKTVAAVEWRVFKPIYEARQRRPLLDQIEAQPKTEAAAAPVETLNFVQQLQGTAPEAQLALLLAHVRDQVAGVLGFEQPELLDLRQGFFKLGMDSMTTVQLRSRLQTSLGCSLPPTVAFEYSTVEALTGYLAKDVLALSTDPQPASPEAVETQAHSEDKATLASLSDDELVALLDRELATIDELMEEN
jgi:acyl carrier protein